MEDRLETEPTLMSVSSLGVRLVAAITKYLSTLPHPIDIIEELVAVCSVTSNLLLTLHSTITRFQLAGSPRAAFVKPLCHDIQIIFTLFSQKVGDAQRLKVFEPNGIGLVRVPRNAWAYVLGGEARMAQFRSRLYVEKYRVRVLIDAVAWQGLTAIVPLDRTPEQVRELEKLTKMLPLVAERLVGVWRDYKPRISNGNAISTQFPAGEVRRVQQPLPVVPAAVVEAEQDDLKRDIRASDGKIGFHSSSSSTSIASSCSSSSTSSSMTMMDDSIYERWIIRRSEARSELVCKSYVLGFPVKSSYDHTASHHYVNPLPSHPSEIQSLISLQIATGSPTSKEILSLPDDAQWEIQNLIEAREKASSNNKVKRSFEVVAFQTQPRRRVSPPVSSSTRRWWKRGGTQGLVEWVLVLKGQTVDRKTRTTPVKHEDAWNPRPPCVLPSPTQIRAQTPQRPIMAPTLAQQMAAAQAAARVGNNGPAPGVHMLRHVEQRRGLGPEEAERKMVEILRDLFDAIEVSGKGETREAGPQGPKHTSD